MWPNFSYNKDFRYSYGTSEYVTPILERKSSIEESVIHRRLQDGFKAVSSRSANLQLTWNAFTNTISVELLKLFMLE